MENRFFNQLNILSEYGEQFKDSSLSIGILVNTVDTIKELEDMNSPMPKKWINLISSDKSVSNEGLLFLVNEIFLNNEISAKKAVEWLELELKNTKKTEEKESLAELNLLKRTKKECGKDLSLKVSITILTNFIKGD